MSISSYYGLIEAFSAAFKNKNAQSLQQTINLMLQNPTDNEDIFQIKAKKEDFKSKAFYSITKVNKSMPAEHVGELIDFFWYINKSLQAYIDEQYSECFGPLNESYSCFTRIFKAADDIWMLEPLRKLTFYLRKYAIDMAERTGSDEGLRLAINSVRGLIALMNLSKA